ncbi:thiamine diphosphokinase [Myroides sp. LJL110]
MSSHHIVRDDQEPALIIANGAACSIELLNQILEWSPLVVVLDSAMQRVMELGIKVDVLLGDFDRDFDPNFYLQKQYPLEIVIAQDQNLTDLEKALDYLIKRKIPSVNIVWATGKRADHTINNMANMVRFKDQIKMVMLDDHSKIFPLGPTYKKWYEKDTILSLIPITEVQGITSSNLRYPLNNSCLKLGYQNGTSNSVLEDGIVCITHKNGDLLLIEAND